MGRQAVDTKATLPADKAYEMGEAIQSSVKAIALPENVSFGATQAEESMEEEFSGIGKAIASDFLYDHSEERKSFR